MTRALKPLKSNTVFACLAAATLGMLGACSQVPTVLTNPLGLFTPSLKIPNESDIIAKVYDGKADDLLTAGLGKTGIGNPAVAAAADPQNPSAKEIRQRTIHANYRALIDASAAGGYGRIYGPNIDLNGGDTLGEGKIAGDEYLALVKDRSGAVNATVMVQIPASFNTAKPCIVSATSSGSRGIYGAIGTAGDWGLKRGCAVAYTDKATGTGIHDLANDRVYLVDGTRSTAASAGARSTFTAELSAENRKLMSEQFPNRLAFKQAHSQQNVERLWGEFTLAAIEFAFDRLNKLSDARKGDYNRDNTIVIASSLSNGAYAALLAAEQDTRGLIDGVVATEPNVSLRYNAGLSIQQGSQDPTKVHSKALLDYTTIVNLFAPCAASHSSLSQAPLNGAPAAFRAARCEGLAAKGFIKGATLEELAAQSIAVLKAHGLQPEALILQPAQYTLAVPQAIAVTYAMAYGRFGVADNLCGYSFAFSQPPTAGDKIGLPIPLAGSEWLFASSNGIAPTAGISLINERALGGARDEKFAPGDGTQKLDLNLDGAICLREVATGHEIAAGGERGAVFAAGSVRRQQADRIAQGIAETIMSAKLQGKPTIIVSPRGDSLLPINHAGRAYYANVLATEPKLAANVRLYEITNTNHLDALNGLPGVDSRFVPIHAYFTQAMNAMWAHLADKAPLPASQVVRTKPRAIVDGKTQMLQAGNLPAISASATSDSVITLSNGVLRIPE